MHHNLSNASYSPADKDRLNALERDRDVTYHQTLEFIKWIVSGVVVILFLMAIFLI